MLLRRDHSGTRSPDAHLALGTFSLKVFITATLVALHGFAIWARRVLTATRAETTAFLSPFATFAFSFSEEEAFTAPLGFAIL